MFGKVKTPALEQLENNFKKQGGEWRKFRIGDLFNSQNGDFDIQKKHLNGQGEYVVSSGELGCGIIGKTDIEARIFKAKTITCDMFGNVFFRKNPYKMVTHARVFSMSYCHAELSSQTGIFIATAMKFFKDKYSYSEMASWVKIKDDFIWLPTNSKGIIAFDYMESYIVELEKQNVEKYKKYLQDIEVGDCQLTQDEHDALNSAIMRGVEWRSFKIKELFQIRPTRSYKMTNIDLFKTSGNIPVVTNSSLSNGVSGYVGLQPTEKGNMITYSDTTTSDGIFYQPKDFVGYSHVQGLYPIDYQANWNRFTLLYFVTAFKKTAFGKFDYGNKFTRNLAQELEVCLPIDSKGKIDFEYMENLVKTLQKQSLAKVMTYFEGGI